jgi:RNA polymerase sigma factor (sigma-70 family)
VPAPLCYVLGVSESSDASLLRAWKAGDERAGVRLYRRHAGSVSRFFRNKTAECDIPDLMQATFMSCFEHSERLTDEASFRAFLLAFARNLLLHHYRTRYRKHDKIDFGVSSVIDLGVSPSAAIAGHEDEQRLLSALRSLAIEHQILLELFYWEGIQGPELAELYALPEGTIRSRLRRARQLLSEAFEHGEVGKSTTLANLDHWAQTVRARLDPT